MIYTMVQAGVWWRIYINTIYSHVLLYESVQDQIICMFQYLCMYQWFIMFLHTHIT